MMKNLKKIFLILIILIPQVANCMESSSEEDYVIPGSKVTNNLIPANPQPIGRINRSNLESDDTRDMFYEMVPFLKEKGILVSLFTDDDKEKNYKELKKIGKVERNTLHNQNASYSSPKYKDFQFIKKKSSSSPSPLYPIQKRDTTKRRTISNSPGIKRKIIHEDYSNPRKKTKMENKNASNQRKCGR